MFPARVSVVTYNLWGSNRWPERSEALGTFCGAYEPDVFCTQELTEETKRFLDESLPKHARVHDAFDGWTTESNIWWRDDLLISLTSVRRMSVSAVAASCAACSGPGCDLETDNRP
jgi:hypothetical protein